MFLDEQRNASLLLVRPMWLTAWAQSLLALVLALSCTAWPAEPLTNTKCPVLVEENVDPALWTEYQGKKVYFCCQQCRREFIEQPGEFVKNLPRSVKSGSPSSEVGKTTAGLGQAETHEHEGTEAHGQHAETARGEHDHGTDHAKITDRSRLLVLLGRLHPVAVHFPIALIVVAALVEVLNWLWPSQRFADAARLMVVVGAASSLVAAVLGWMAGLDARYPSSMMVVLERHRWLGLSAAAVATLAGVLALVSTRTSGVRWVWSYRAALISAVILVTLTGYYGGTLVFGPDHFSW